ncbi:MAG: glycosyltransferase [Ignavibacteria bacterium]|nr:glycosyltransferase [Ignavibacteria bacterium]
MTDRTVLVIAYYFPPMGLSGVLRTVKLIKHLADYGWKPIVLTTTPRTFYAYDETLLTQLEERNVEIYRTPAKKGILTSRRTGIKKLPGFFRKNFIRPVSKLIYQPDPTIRWRKQAMMTANEIMRNHRVNIILATAPPFSDFMIASEIAEEHSLPFVVDYRDSWIDTSSPVPFRTSKMRKLEANILARAAKTIVTTRFAKENLIRRYQAVGHEDVMILPHGYDGDDFRVENASKVSHENFILTHCGVFQEDCTPKYFLKALSNFISKNPTIKSKIEARFVGTMQPNHTKYIAKYGLDGVVHCTGYVPHNEAIKHLCESDVLWLTANNAERLPGKLFEYIGAKKPLLVCAPDGSICKTAIDTKAAITTAPTDIKAIESAISTLYNAWSEGKLPKPDSKYAALFETKLLTSDLSRELAISARM